MTNDMCTYVHIYLSTNAGLSGNCGTIFEDPMFKDVNFKSASPPLDECEFIELVFACLLSYDKH